MIHHMTKSFLLETPFKLAHEFFWVNNSVPQPHKALSFFIYLYQLNDLFSYFKFISVNCDQPCVDWPTTLCGDSSDQSTT